MCCDHCHVLFVQQFLKSAHARSTRDPLLQDLYSGVTQAAQDVAGWTSLALRPGLVPGRPARLPSSVTWAACSPT